MKYGIVVDGRVTEPVSIPSPLPSWAEDAEAFLAKLFPDKSGWVVVPDDAVPGTIATGEGGFEAPAGTLAPKRWDAYDFTSRFTADERKAIRAAAKVSADVEDFLHMLDLAGATGTMIVATNSLLVEALDALVVAELITPERRDVILA